MTNAVQIEEAAARWIIRQSEGEWGVEDQAALDAWLEEASEHKVAFWRMEMGWAQTDRITALRTPLPSAVNDEAPRRNWMIASAASAVAAIVIASFVPWRSLTPQPAIEAHYATETGGHNSIPLPDGSSIELNTRTQVRTQMAARSREVWLDKGEAYFEVAHDAARPFIVHAGPKTITDVGTKFSVRRDGDRVEVAVIEGSVRVEDAAPSAATAETVPVLTRGDMVISQAGSTILAPKSVEAVSSGLAWREGMLSFDQVTLADAAAEFNRYNDKQLIVSGEAARMRIGGSFQARNVDVFVRLLQRTYGLRIDDEGASVKISQ